MGGARRILRGYAPPPPPNKVASETVKGSVVSGGTSSPIQNIRGDTKRTIYSKSAFNETKFKS